MSDSLKNSGIKTSFGWVELANYDSDPTDTDTLRGGLAIIGGYLKIWDGSAWQGIEASEIADNAVITSKILDANVTDAKIAAPKLSKLTGSFALADMTDGGTAAATYELGTIPLGAVVTRTLVTGITGFIGDTTAVITIGDGSTANRYNTGTPSVFTTITALDVGAVSGTIYHSAEKTVTVTITAGSEWGDVTAGAATVTIFYYTAS